MRGTVLGYDATSHTGAISGHDGNRYDFAVIEWKSPGLPMKGMLVDFVAVDGQATKIYVVEAPVARSESWLGFLFSSNSRIPRKRYWLSYILPALAIYFVAAILDTIITAGSPERVSPVQLLVSLFFLWPSFAIAAKRLHDRGMSGWWAAFANAIVPVVVLAVAAYWYYTTKMKAPDGTLDAPPDPTIGLVLALICLALMLAWLFFTVQIAFIRGQTGANKYGEDPLPTPSDVRSDNIVTAIFGTLTVLFFLILPVSAYWYYTTKMKPSDGLSQSQPLQDDPAAGDGSADVPAPPAE